MTAFGIILILGGLLPLLALARWRPSSLRRPTWWAGLLYLLQLGIAAAWIPSEIESPLVSGSVAIESRIPEQAARLATVSFPACLCLWIVLTPMLDPRPRRTDPEPADGERPATAEVLLLAAALSLVGLGVLSLLSAVSLTDTGLWALLTDPASTVERREATFKLLPSGLVKTIYGHATTVGMPLSVALLVSRRWLSPPALDASLRTGLVALILLAGSLSGARSPAACEHRLRLPKLADHQARTVPCSFHQEPPRPTRRPTGLLWHVDQYSGPDHLPPPRTVSEQVGPSQTATRSRKRMSPADTPSKTPNAKYITVQWKLFAKSMPSTRATAVKNAKPIFASLKRSRYRPIVRRAVPIITAEIATPTIPSSAHKDRKLWAYPP
jgi:hypothetical protein